MKKIISILLALYCGFTHAASLPFDELPEDLLDGMGFASSFTRASKPEIDESFLGMINSDAKHGVYSIGKEPGKTGWAKNFELRTQHCAAFTISFDLLDIKGTSGQTLMGLYTPGRIREQGLRLAIARKGKLELLCNCFADANLTGRKAKRTLGSFSELKGKTITLTYDRGERRVRVYVDGKKIGKDMHLTHDAGIIPHTTVQDITWGVNHGGGGLIQSASIDNLYFWRDALDDDEIVRIIRPAAFPIHWIIGGCSGVALLVIALLLVLIKRNSKIFSRSK